VETIPVLLFLFFIFFIYLHIALSLHEKTHYSHTFIILLNTCNIKFYGNANFRASFYINKKSKLLKILEYAIQYILLKLLLDT